MEKLYSFTASELTNLLKEKKVSAVEISESFISRTNEIDPVAKAWVAYDSDYIMSQAKYLDSTDKNGLLKGIPVGIKDVFNTEFYPTQKGTPIWKNYKSGNDARCVSYLRYEGAVIFGKTDTAELAVHANQNARNPYNINHVAGSSSGGSAVAVATGMVPVALGTQTGGSIIRPASWCGVYGMKPSFGLIPRTGVLKTTDTLDNIGFFSRNVNDLGLLLDVLRVHGHNFPIQEKGIHKYTTLDKDTWRIAFCDPFLAGSLNAYALDSLNELKQEMSSISGMDIQEVRLPAALSNFRSLHRRIYHPCLSYYLRYESDKYPDLISSTLQAIFDDAKLIPPEDYADALKEQAVLSADFEQIFLDNRIDALVFISSNGSAPYAIEPEIHQDFNALWTMTGLPVINVPKFKCKDGRPYGFQVIGPKYSDYRLLSLLNYFKKHELFSGIAPVVNVTPSKNSSDDL